MNRRRMWTARIVLEQLLHSQSVFATLTYDEEHLPNELKPSHLRDFLKRLRRRYEPAELRFFGVGEYGDQTWRPHYHLALFGVSLLDGEVVQAAWGQGFTMLGELNESSAGYVAGYVTKKMVDADDPRLMGRHPEFARMSLKPGIGADAADGIARALLDEGGSRALGAAGDVPIVARVGGRKLPLGRYLRTKFREAVGWSASTPQEVVKALAVARSLESDDVVREREVKRKQGALSVTARLKIKNSWRRL